MSVIDERAERSHLAKCHDVESSEVKTDKSGDRSIRLDVISHVTGPDIFKRVLNFGPSTSSTSSSSPPRSPVSILVISPASASPLTIDPKPLLNLFYARFPPLRIPPPARPVQARNDMWSP